MHYWPYSSNNQENSLFSLEGFPDTSMNPLESQPNTPEWGSGSNHFDHVMVPMPMLSRAMASSLDMAHLPNVIFGEDQYDWENFEDDMPWFSMNMVLTKVGPLTIEERNIKVQKFKEKSKRRVLAMGQCTRRQKIVDGRRSSRKSLLPKKGLD